MKHLIFSVFACLILFSSCENPTIPLNQGNESGVKVVFNISYYSKIPFEDATSATSDKVSLSDICSRLNVVIFKDGDNYKTIRQKSEDSDFGAIEMNLEEGQYKIVVIAHNCVGTATISSPDKITFPNNKITDTFYYYGDITVDNPREYSIELTRCVAMFRLVTEDNIPADVRYMEFIYTGGSSTFSASDGYGYVKSKQTEIREVTSDMIGKPAQFDIYTFPHKENKDLKITVTAYNSDNEALYTREFSNVEIKRNMITRYTGRFFEKEEEYRTSSFSFTINSEWEYTDYRY